MRLPVLGDRVKVSEDLESVDPVVSNGAAQPQQAAPVPKPAAASATPASDPPAKPREGESDPLEVMAWARRRFANQNMVMTTGFGMEGCVLADMAARVELPLRIFYIDTHFLFAETLQLRDRLAERYPMHEFVNIGTGYTPAQQAVEHGPDLWRRDPDLCCKIRKVEPLVEAMKSVDVWIAAIRREQSESRANTHFVEWNWKHELLKVSPLAYWSRAQVWAYVQERRVPYNPLHEQGYPSIGCTNCTKQVPGVGPDGYSREGRWAGSGKTECGLHLGSGI